MNHRKTLIEELAEVDRARECAHAAVDVMYELIMDGACGAARIGAVCEEIRQGAAAAARSVALRQHAGDRSLQAVSFKSAGFVRIPARLGGSDA